MYKILALNCLITAYSLSVQYLDGIKFGDYQVTITGMLMSVCFLCISRAKVSQVSNHPPVPWLINVIVACGEVEQRTTFREHFQLICPLVCVAPICHSYHGIGVYHRFIQVDRRVSNNLALKSGQADVAE